MTRFRKKPVVIEAVQFDGSEEGALEVLRFCGRGPIWYPAHGTIEIPTLEGTMTARAGDWVIRGVAGELYPCRDDVFRATYETVAECEEDGPCH